MIKKYRYLFTDSKIPIVLLLLLTGCGTEPQIVNNKEGFVQPSRSSSAVSSRASSAAALNNALTVSSSSHQNKNTLAQRSSAGPVKLNVQAPLRASSSSNASSQAFATTSSSFATQANSSSSAQSNASLATQAIAKNLLGGISGVVKVTGKNGEILSPEGVIVNLEPTNTANDVAISQEKSQHDVHMLNKAYMPKLMTIKQNDQIIFSNKDKIKHNVFSTSVGNRFDLGTYGQGEKNKVALKTPGVVKVYCNIHPEMALFVSVSPNNYSHITNKNGFFEIGNLPPGEYRLTAWHIRGETQQVVNVQGLRTKKDVLINTEAYVPVPHKNKHDEAYKVKAVLFEDEFY